MESLPRLEHVQATAMPSVSMRKCLWTKHQPQQDPAERGLVRHTGDARSPSLSCILKRDISFFALRRRSEGSCTPLRRPEAPKLTSYNPLKALQGPSPVTLDKTGLQTFKYATSRQRTHSRNGRPEASVHATEKRCSHRNIRGRVEGLSAKAAPVERPNLGTICVTKGVMCPELPRVP